MDGLNLPAMTSTDVLQRIEYLAVVTFISNARMYAVSPEAEAAWDNLIAHVADDAGTSFVYLTYEAPRPLEQLWRRPDLGCVQMCGFPIALEMADVVPLASPVPAAPWARARAVYRTDLIVRKDAPYKVLADTFGGTAGWTVEHSHSGFNALRHHLLPWRSDGRPQVYRHCLGHLVSARRILESVVDGTIDIGAPRCLLAHAHREVRWRDDRDHPRSGVDGNRADAGIRRLPGTARGNGRSPARILCRGAFASLVRPIQGSASDREVENVTRETFHPTLAWDRAARVAGYPVPA